MKIGITLTSSLQVGQEYTDLTRAAAKCIAESSHSIVYGGTNYGMMRELAQAYKECRGKELIGVMAKELMTVTTGYAAFEKLDEKHLVDTIGERIAKITHLSDALLILPGGYGTVEELAAMIGGKVNKLYDKPIAMYNYDGFYDTAISFFNELYQKKFTKIKFEEVVSVGNNINEILNYFAGYRPARIADKFI